MRSDGAMWSRNATGADIWHVCQNLRAADAEEVFALRRDANRTVLAVELMARREHSVLSLAFGLDSSPNPFAYLELCDLGETGHLLAGNVIGTDDFARIGVPLAQLIRRTFPPLLLAKGVHRIECRVLATHRAARKWIRLCGATVETEMADYGPKRQTFVLCAWRRGDFEAGGAHAAS